MSPRLWMGFALAVLLVSCGEGDGTDAGAGLDSGSADAGATDAGATDAGATDAGAMDAGNECTPEHVAWHPIELSFEGPSASETDDAPNPFTDYRLRVTLTTPNGATVVVPGFFDGDGRGGATGTAWKARFHVGEPGEHTWVASFVAGDGVALDPDAAGTNTSFDGATGSLCVGEPDPGAPGFLGHGRLDHVDAHYLQLADGAWWIKAGADSPENLLGYAGFDGAEDLPGGVPTDGLIDGLHRFAPHIDDWRPGDPDWGDGAGRGIIGALNYLASEEVNSIYFLPCNLGGDGRDTHPYVAPDDLSHIDLSRMRQWELVFAHAQRLGIALHFVLSETETGNENLHDGGTLGPERRLFYRELVARFGHHLALFWNIGEENDYGPDRQREFAGYIRDLDPFDHPITVHSHWNRPEDQYAALVGDSRFELTSIQLAPDRAGEFTETWRTRSAEAGRPWVVMLDEIGPAGIGVTDMNAPEIRRLTLWPALMSGAGGVEWYFGYHALPLGGDMRTEDFRTRAPMWRFTRIARRFFEEELPLSAMTPRDDLLSGATGDVFMAPDEVYAVYLPDGSPSAALDLSGASGTFEQRWFDPRAGTFEASSSTITGGGSLTLGAPPSAPGEDWVVLIAR